MKIAIVGLGYWGPNLVRNFLATPGVSGVVCCDIQTKRLNRIRRMFPNVEVTTEFERIRTRKDIDAVAIATPVSTHYRLGMQVLNAGKHLLLEKPMATSAEEAEKLVELADRNNLTLLVDHTFIYTGAVRKIKELITSGRVGDILYFDSVRVNLGLFQHDTNVVWDLAPHDLSIMDYLIEEKPVSVSAFGVNHYNGVEDMAYLTVNFADKLIAHFHVNWLSPVKIRRILLGGSKHMVWYDDMTPSEKVKVYDRGVDLTEEESVYKTLVQYRVGDMYAPQVDQTEALSIMAQEFVTCIETNKSPVTNGESGIRIVRILEAADESLRQNGRLISINSLIEI